MLSNLDTCPILDGKRKFQLSVFLFLCLFCPSVEKSIAGDKLVPKYSSIQTKIWHPVGVTALNGRCSLTCLTSRLSEEFAPLLNLPSLQSLQGGAIDKRQLQVEVASHASERASTFYGVHS